LYSFYCYDKVNYDRLFVQGFSTPENWSSGDLVDLGDLLILLTADDFKKVRMLHCKLGNRWVFTNGRTGAKTCFSLS
jgi:hypothetical protein